MEIIIFLKCKQILKRLWNKSVLLFRFHLLCTPLDKNIWAASKEFPEGIWQEEIVFWIIYNLRDANQVCPQDNSINLEWYISDLLGYLKNQYSCRKLHQESILSSKLKFQTELKLCSGYNASIQRSDRRTDMNGQGESSLPPTPQHDFRKLRVMWYASHTYVMLFISKLSHILYKTICHIIFSLSPHVCFSQDCCYCEIFPQCQLYIYI